MTYDFWYYLKPKLREKAKICYMNVDSFIVYISTDGIYIDIAENVEKKYDTSNYERPLPRRKIKKFIGLMKDKLGGKIMTEFNVLTPNTYSYLKDDSYEMKRQKTQK